MIGCLYFTTAFRDLLDGLQGEGSPIVPAVNGIDAVVSMNAIRLLLRTSAMNELLIDVVAVILEVIELLSH